MQFDEFRNDGVKLSISSLFVILCNCLSNALLTLYLIEYLKVIFATAAAAANVC